MNRAYALRILGNANKGSCIYEFWTIANFEGKYSFSQYSGFLVVITQATF